jgi:hypothetical protein
MVPSPEQFSQRPPFTLKLKAPRLVAPHFCFRGFGKKCANLVKNAGVGGRVGPGGAPDRGLVNVHNFVESVDTGIRVCIPGTCRAPFRVLAKGAIDNVVDSVDLPDPLTPVTATKSPKGISTLMSCRLLALAPSTVMCVADHAAVGRSVKHLSAPVR